MMTPWDRDRCASAGLVSAEGKLSAMKEIQGTDTSTGSAVGMREPSPDELQVGGAKMGWLLARKRLLWGFCEEMELVLLWITLLIERKIQGTRESAASFDSLSPMK